MVFHSHGEGVFVIAVTDILALKSLIGTLVSKTLSIVHIAITRSTSEGLGVGNILEVEEDEARPTRTGPGCGPDRHTKLAALMHHHVVGSAER